MAIGGLESKVASAQCWAEPQLMEQYRAFGRECREIILGLIASGAYPNLCSNKMRHVPVERSLGARVNVIGRPYMQHAGTGSRNLNVGDSEIVFVVQAPFISADDYMWGFLLPEGRGWLRIVAGNGLVNDAIKEMTNVDAIAIMLSEAKAQLPELSTYVSQGKYKDFVQKLLGIANSAVNKLMSEYPLRPS